MKETIRASSGSRNRPSRGSRAALPPFTHEDGYTLSATDLGKLGVKIELKHRYDTAGAIILPPKQVAECGRWMLETLEQESHGLPKGLRGILERLSRQSGFKPTLERGDKKKIRDALKVLNSQRSKARAEESALTPFSRRAM
ncbi:MAG: hypothetical protein ABIF19_21685 [Planctomycetota bacterium]